MLEKYSWKMQEDGATTYLPPWVRVSAGWLVNRNRITASRYLNPWKVHSSHQETV